MSLSRTAFSTFFAAALLAGGITGCNDKTGTSAPATGAYGAPAGGTMPASEPATPPASAGTASIPADGVPPVGNPSETAQTMPAAPPLNPNAPFAGGMDGDPNAPLTPTPDMDKKIVDLQTGDKKALAAALADRGFARMTDENAGRKLKYREALTDFNAALKADPTNAKARENKDTIESIYTSMGRPIPGTEGDGAKK